MLTKFRLVSIFFFLCRNNSYAQTQPRTVAGGLRPHLSKAGLRPEPGLEQLESAEQLDSFGYLGCGGYLARHSSCYFLLRHLHSENAKRFPFSFATLLKRRHFHAV